jgi:hypothetical protein
MAVDVVEFRLCDGTYLVIPRADFMGVYEALWGLSAERGAISTAALLMEGARKSARHRHSVELTIAQGDVLKQAVARSPISPSSARPEAP